MEEENSVNQEEEPEELEEAGQQESTRRPMRLSRRQSETEEEKGHVRHEIEQREGLHEK